MIKSNIELEHQTRKMIFNHIVEYPGVSFSTLKKFYNLNDSTLRYHLKYLERGEKIKPHLTDGKLHYYPYNSSDGTSNISVNSLKTRDLTPNQQKILAAIKRQPGINQTELIARTSLKRYILTYNISKLINFGMVRKFNHQKNVRYEFVTDDVVQDEMLRVLVMKLLNNEIDEKTFLKLKNKLR
jgi:predicted transcriptional regulator